jgi:hypothetical protein
MKNINNNCLTTAVTILARGEWEAISLSLLLLSFKNKLQFPEKFNKSSNFLFTTSADFSC